MFGHGETIQPITASQSSAIQQRGNLATCRRNLLQGGAGVIFLAACSNPGKSAPPATADTSVSTSVGTTPVAEALKVAQLGVATPDKLAQMGDRQSIVDEFTLKASYATSAKEVVETLVYLNRAHALAGTTPAEIDKRRGSIDGYASDVSRFDGPAIEAQTGVAPQNPTTAGLSQRHEFVARRAFIMRGYDKASSYSLEETPSNIVMTEGSYESGKFTAMFEVALKDTLAGSQAVLNDPSIKSINGRDLCTTTFTKRGERWTAQTTSAVYEAAKSQG